MIIEHALLRVAIDKQSEFEAAMMVAKPLIAASPGFLGLEIRPALEAPGLFLLLVHWESVADHREGFRDSDRYQQWKALLHGFYDSMPTVTYFGDPL